MGKLNSGGLCFENFVCRIFFWPSGMLRYCQYWTISKEELSVGRIGEHRVVVFYFHPREYSYYLPLDFRIPLQLARYADSILKKSQRNLNESEQEEKMADIVSFPVTTEKYFYIRHLQDADLGTALGFFLRVKNGFESIHWSSDATHFRVFEFVSII